MNEHIQDIATQAWKKTSDEVAYLNRIHNRSLGHDETMDIFEIKFAELIVKECAAAVKNSIWHLPRGYKAEDQADFVKKHFGVE